jgi:hypothetical protein
MTRRFAVLALAGAVALPPLLPAAEVKFEPQTIDPAIEIGYGLAIADVDGDAKDDVLLADKRDIVWYRNPTWEKHVLAHSLTLRDNVCIAARDLDGDGKCEIAVGANWNPGETKDEAASGSVHYLVAPEDRTKLWTAVTLPHEPTVHRMHWRRNEKGKWELVMLPLHGRGNVKGAGAPVRVMAYSWPADPKDAKNWSARVIQESLHLTHNFDVARTPSGPEAMIIGGAEGLVTMAANGSSALTIQAASFPGTAGLGEVRYGPNRIERGRSLTHYAAIEPMHGNQLTVYSTGSETAPDHQPVWHREVIDESLADGHALACGDLLGTGREQIVAGWRKPDAAGKVGIRLYDWDEGGAKWGVHLVDDNGMAAEDLKLADLNGDGRLDIIAAGRTTKNVKIYWNRSTPAKPTALDTRWRKHELWKWDACATAVAADANGDGKPDVLFSAVGKDWLIVWPNGKPVELYAGKDRTRGCIHCTAFDVDRDGDLDFIGGARMVYWLENPGGTKAEAGHWTFHVAEDQITGIHCVLAGDINRDGREELLTNEFNPGGPIANSLMWLEPPTAPGKPWARHVFASGDAAGGNHYFDFGDLDGDGDNDIACAAKGKPFQGGNWFAWWENTGALPWRKHLLAEGRIGATNIVPADLDGDGDVDLMASCGHGTGVLWFENRGGGLFPPHEIDPMLSGPHCLAVADLDGDGDADAATVGKDDFRAVWYENDGKGTFAVRDIDDQQAAYDLRAIDLDADGDKDLLVAGQLSRNVVWYENQLR